MSNTKADVFILRSRVNLEILQALVNSKSKSKTKSKIYNERHGGTVAKEPLTVRSDLIYSTYEGGDGGRRERRKRKKIKEVRKETESERAWDMKVVMYPSNSPSIRTSPWSTGSTRRQRISSLVHCKRSCVSLIWTQKTLSGVWYKKHRHNFAVSYLHLKFIGGTR